MLIPKEIFIRYFQVQVADIVYLKAVLESYEGMVVVRSLEGAREVIELLIAADFAELIEFVIQDLQQEIPLTEINPLSLNFQNSSTIAPT